MEFERKPARAITADSAAMARREADVMRFRTRSRVSYVDKLRTQISIAKLQDGAGYALHHKAQVASLESEIAKLENTRNQEELVKAHAKSIPIEPKHTIDDFDDASSDELDNDEVMAFLKSVDATIGKFKIYKGCDDEHDNISNVDTNVGSPRNSVCTCDDESDSDSDEDEFSSDETGDNLEDAVERLKADMDSIEAKTAKLMINYQFDHNTNLIKSY